MAIADKRSPDSALPLLIADRHDYAMDCRKHGNLSLPVYFVFKFFVL